MKRSSSSSSDGGSFQNSYYVGVNLENILYGVELVIYLKTVQILLSRNKGSRKKSDVLYAAFSTVMLFMVTIWVATSAVFGEEMWLLNNDYPGGPNAYWEDNISTWYMDMGTTSAIILQLMTDALMIYRCQVIWNSRRAIIVPTFLWLSTLVLGILVDWSSSSPGGDFFTGFASELGLVYYTLSVFLNTTLTCMICYRMMRHGRKVQEGLGNEYASPYFAIITIVVESVFPYTLSGIAFLVSLGCGSSTSTAFVGVYILFMCISPQMLILRVIMGSAWHKNTCVLPSSTLKFTPQRNSSQWIDGGVSGAETRVQLQTLSQVYVPDGRNSKTDLASAAVSEV